MRRLPGEDLGIEEDATEETEVTEPVTETAAESALSEASASLVGASRAVYEDRGQG